VLFIVGVCSIPLLSFSTVRGRVLVYRSVTFMFEIQELRFFFYFNHFGERVDNITVKPRERTRKLAA
jgi:hypothetical protein